MISLPFTLYHEALTIHDLELHIEGSIITEMVGSKNARWYI
jgi:hypothetical protein